MQALSAVDWPVTSARCGAPRNAGLAPSGQEDFLTTLEYTRVNWV